ncbi:MAG: PHP domain-containing protein [Candidatus Lokiarchaeota archaeon]|nr:PHP domain-containing protein [Candidatus Lokiarchaeota archaeon]
MPGLSISKTEAKKFFGRFLAFTIIGASIIATTILVAEFGPPDRVYGDDAFDDFPSNYVPPEFNASRHNVLLDQHSHTIWSDGVLTPEQNIIWHIKHGFNAAVITDHNNIQGAQEAQRIAREKYNSVFKVIIGEEWTTSRIHMNFLGVSSVILPGITVSDTDIQAAINAAHEQGALVTVNHIPWSLRQGMDHPSRSALVSWGIDFIEMVNENEYDNESEPFLLDPPGAITGTDMHSPTTVHGWTALWVPEFTEEAIMAQLAIRNTTIIHNTTGSRDYTKPPTDNPAYLALKPVIMFGELFEDIATDSTLTLVLGLLYLYGAFFVAEALRIVKRRYWEAINARPAEKSRKNAKKAA